MATNYQIFFTKVGSGIWNGNPSADPVANVGGIDLSAMIGLTMFPTLQASGEGWVSANFGATAFAGTVPANYIAGWPASGGGFTVLSPDRLFGTASITDSLLMKTSIAAGMAQAVDGYAAGAYYFELTNAGADIFSVDQGGGVGQDYTNGGSFDFWLESCAFSAGNVLGGGGFTGGPGEVTLRALNETLATNVFTFPENSTVGVAMFLSPNGPPGPPQPTILAQPIPQSLQRWRGQVGLNWKGMALVGDAFTNVVGLSDFTNFTEYGNSMQFLITTPPMHEDRKRIFMPRFEIEVEAGDGIVGNPETPPLMMLEWSKDGGKTWSTLQPPRSMGVIGQYIKRLRWLNLGNSRTWVFRLTCTDNVRRYVIGAYTTDYKSLG
jgi:hypothetical protein